MSMTSAPSSFCSLRQQRERGSEAVENDVFHFELQTFHRANRVLQPVEIAVNDVHVHLHPRAEHPDGIGDAVLAIDEEMLADGMQRRGSPRAD